MRRLMWFTIGFAIACGLCVWLLPIRGMAACGLAAAGLLGLFLWRRLPRAALVTLGCLIGLGWYFCFAKCCLLPAQAMDGTTCETTVTATGYSYNTDYGVGVDGEFVSNGRKYRVRLYLHSARELCPGDTISGTFRLRYTAPGGMEEPTYHAGEGVLFLGYQRGSARIRKAAEGAVSDLGITLNHNIGQRLTALFPPEVEAFARALLLGDDYDLSYETDTALKISGIRHVVAVSGLHVAILYTILRTLTLNHRWLMALLGLPVLYLFAAVAQFTPSVSRACIMVGLMILAQLLNKEYDSATALSFSALVMLMENPLVITSISFQMSFACVAGILLFRKPISRWLQGKLGIPRGKNLKARLLRWFTGSVSVSLSATVLTTPLSAWYFGTVSLVGLLTNLLTLWAVSLSFYGIVAVVLLSLFWMKGASLLALAAAVPMGYVLRISKLLAAFPLAAVYTKSVYIVLWLVLVYILLAVLYFGRVRRPLVLTCCAVLGLCLALLVSWNEHCLSDTHFTALDVGQGQCLILHTEGKTYLIDCGGSSDETAADQAAQTLLSRGITHLDGIILTHGDRDHAGGIPHLLTRIGSGFIMLPGSTAPETVEALTARCSGQVIPVWENLVLELETGKISVFAPDFAPESNENSLCILFEGEKCAILVTGDLGSLGEALLMGEAALPEVDLLMAGHHGSKYSTSEDLLAVTSPETVFISVGEGNAYGHPAQELLDRLKAHGCRICRTDLNGTLIFRR